MFPRRTNIQTTRVEELFERREAHSVTTAHGQDLAAHCLVLLDEPTQGIDVGARAAVYDLINELTEAGNAKPTLPRSPSRS